MEINTSIESGDPRYDECSSQLFSSRRIVLEESLTKGLCVVFCGNILYVV